MNLTKLIREVNLTHIKIFVHSFHVPSFNIALLQTQTIVS